MTTTSLQAYLTSIDQMLEQEQYEAVVGHGFHILKHFPRHIDTYRLVAKGLLGLKRYDEAKELFHRILSADPNDLISHVALADLAQMDNKSDEAQYHLERALELDPYNGAIQQELNRYYDTDDFGVGRIQLNEGGLARLYMRGELYDQATSLLSKLVNQEDERIDLEVLLSEALWREGSRVEAAEMSLKVLDSLPNCIKANAIISDIWFNSDRIGDAKKKARNLQSMVLLDQETADPETVVGTALKSAQAPDLPERIELTPLERVSSEDVAVSMQEIKPSDTAVFDDVESDPGDMFDWLSDVVKPSAEQRLEEVIEPDSWPAGEGEQESDWFLDEELAETAVVPDEDASHPGSFEEEPLEEQFTDPDSADELVLKFNEQAEPNAAVPEWIATANAETSPLELAEENNSNFFESQTDVEVPDWLSNDANEELEPIQLDPVTASQWLTEGLEPEEENDDYENLPEGVKSTQDWMADISQEFTDIIDEESQPAEWLTEESEVNDSDSADDDWFAELTESQANINPTHSEDSDSAVSEDWLSDDWLLADDESNQLTESIDPSAAENEQDLAPTMNNEESENEKKENQPQDADQENGRQPQEPKKEEEPIASDADDWLAQLTSGSDDDDDDWLAEFTADSGEDVDEMVEADHDDDSVSNFLAELQGEEGDTPEAESEDLGDIDQWLQDLSSGDDVSPDDWLTTLVEEESEEQQSGFTDWLNQAVVDEHEANEEQPAEPSAASLTDLLNDEEDAASGDNEFDWLDDESGITDLLSEPGLAMESDATAVDLPEASTLDDGPSLTDILDEVSQPDEEPDQPEESFDWLNESSSLTDLLDDEVSEPGNIEMDETGETDWLSEESGLTDLLSDAALAGKDDEDTAVIPDFTESQEEDENIPTLTDLLDDSEDEASVALPDGEGFDWLNDDSGLTDLLSDSGLSPEGDPEMDAADSQDDEGDLPGLTDLLGDEETAVDAPSSAPPILDEDDEEDWLNEETSLTDLLGDEATTDAETESPEAVALDEPEGDWLKDDTGLTDLLSDAGFGADDEPETDETDLFADDDGLPGLTDMLEDDESSEEISPQEEDGSWLDESAGLTDLLGDGSSEEEQPSAKTAIEWDDDELGLTGMLSEAGLGVEEDTETQASDELDEMAGLTALLGEADDEDKEPLVEDEGNWLEDESGLTDFLSDAGFGIDDADAENESVELDDGPSLTDLLGESAQEDDGEETAVSEDDWETEVDGLTDLLSEAGLETEQEEPLATDLAQLAESQDVSLTDMLNNEEELTADPSLTDMLSEEGLLDSADAGEDALDSIDTNLPDWLAHDEEVRPNAPEDMPDWMADIGVAEEEGLSDEAHSFLTDEATEEDEEEVQTTSMTGLLGKIDDVSAIKAEAEERERAEIEAAKPFEPEMADYLTSPDDTAWLNQLSGTEEDQEEDGLDWMDDVRTDSELDWLDSDAPPAKVEESPVEELPSEKEPVEEDGDTVDTPGDLDDAMSWLEDLAAEQEKPIEPLPTVAEVLDSDDAWTDLDEDEELGDLSLTDLLNEEDASDEADSLVFEEETAVSTDDDAVDDAMAEIDDAMAWLDDLDAQADALADEQSLFDEEQPTVVERAPTTVVTGSTDDAADEPIEMDSVGADDVPEDIDDAMAWLEQLAAKQGAPIEELPSISEADTVVNDSSADEEHATHPEPQTDEELMAALDWLEETAVSQSEAEDEVTTTPKTTTAELPDTLDWLAEVARQPAVAEESDPPLVEESLAEEAIDDSDGFDEDLDEPSLSDYFDMPDDPDEAMAWLNEEPEGEFEAEEVVELLDDESTEVEGAPDDADDEMDSEAIIDLLEAEVQDTDDSDEEADEPELDGEAVVELLDEAVEETSDIETDESDDEPSADDLLAGVFDIPDDPDEAMAWLEEVADDEPEATAEEETAVVDTPISSDQSSPVEEVDEAVEETDEDFLATVPDDEAEAMAWLEQLAARQGAPLEELPSVDEPVDDMSVPSWITGDTGQLRDPEPDEGMTPSEERDDEIEAEEDLPEGLPDWFSLDEVEGDEENIPSQTDWLDSVPEFGGSDWLASESEASSIVSESIEVLPDTGPLYETSQDPQPDLEPMEEPPEAGDENFIIDEPDSSVYQLDGDQLSHSKMAIEDGRYDSAVNTLQNMVAEGNGLMMLIGELEQIAEENPKQPAFRRLLGDAYMRNGQLQKALTTYREALDQL